MLERGDDLDEKISKAEKEIKAMENTLLLVDVTNSSLKKLNTIVDENGEFAFKIGKSIESYFTI